MGVTTPAAHPNPHSEPVQACRPREGSAAAARSRCVSLIDDEHASAGLLALVLQLRFEHAPAGIQHGLGHPCLDELGAAHIADEDPLILIDHPGREFMQGILAPARSSAVQALGLTRVAAALCPGDLLLDVSIEMTRLEPLPIARRHRILQPQIKSDLLVRGQAGGEGALDGNTQPPVPEAILGETPASAPPSLELILLEDAKRFTGEAQRATPALQLRRLEGHPAE